MAIVIMIINYDRVPEMFNIIFSSAFGTHAAFGAMMGLAVEWGIKRGIYANEAGQGSGPHAAASEVSHPAKQGYVQAFAIYFDTMMVCTATAFLILASGTYNVYSPAGGRRADLPGPGRYSRRRGLCAGRCGSGAAGLGLGVRVDRHLLLRLHHHHGLLLHGRNQPDLRQPQQEAPADRAVPAPGHHRHGGVRRVP
jgi:hypothetical protein